MFSFLFFSISRAWRGFWRNAAMSLAATATMTLMLLLLSSFWIVQAGFLASLSYIEDKVGVVADLDETSVPRISPIYSAAGRDAGGPLRGIRLQGGGARRASAPNGRPRARRTSRPISPRTRCRRASRSSCEGRTTYRTIATFLGAEPIVASVKNIEDTTDGWSRSPASCVRSASCSSRSSARSCCSSLSTPSGSPCSVARRRSRSCGS